MILNKKLPEWVGVAVGSIVAALAIGAAAWAWDINATMSSNMARMDYINTRAIDAKSDVNEAILKLDKRINHLENKQEHRFEILENKIEKFCGKR